MEEAKTSEGAESCKTQKLMDLGLFLLLLT